LSAVFCPKNLATAEKYCFARLRGYAAPVPACMPMLLHIDGTETQKNAIIVMYISNSKIL